MDKYIRLEIKFPGQEKTVIHVKRQADPYRVEKKPIDIVCVLVENKEQILLTRAKDQDLYNIGIYETVSSKEDIVDTAKRSLKNYHLDIEQLTFKGVILFKAEKYSHRIHIFHCYEPMGNLKKEYKKYVSAWLTKDNLDKLDIMPESLLIDELAQHDKAFHIIARRDPNNPGMFELE